METHIRVINKRARVPDNLGSVIVVDTTSTSAEEWSRGLSPFFVGPVPLYNGRLAANVENAWQYTKVYSVHIDADRNPLPCYWTWASEGWTSPTAKRYPMGRGARPEYSLWNGEKHNYISARKHIYCPLYANGVVITPAYARLQTLYEQCVFENKTLVLRDYDGYNYTASGKTLQQVLDDPQKKMGHSFVLTMLLLEQHLW